MPASLTLAIVACALCAPVQSQKSRLLNLGRYAYPQQSNPGHRHEPGFQRIGSWIYFPATTHEGRDWFRMPAGGRATRPQRVSQLARFHVEETLSRIVALDSKTMLFLATMRGQGVALFATSVDAASLGATRRIAMLGEAPLNVHDSPGELTRVAGTRLYLVHRPRQTWTTDGTAMGTRVLPSTGVYPLFADTNSRRLYCSTDDGGSPPRTVLAYLDATTRALTRIATLAAYDSVAPTSVHRFGSRWLFLVSTEKSGAELWSTDGSASGTRKIHSIVAQNAPRLSPRAFACVLLGRYYFFAFDSKRQIQLWSSDGSAAGTRAETQWTSTTYMFGGAQVVHGKIGFPFRNGPTTQYGIYDPKTRSLTTLPLSNPTRAFELSASKLHILTDDLTPALHESDGTVSGTRKIMDLPARTTLDTFSVRNPGHYIVRASATSMPFPDHQETFVLEPGDSQLRLLVDLYPSSYDVSTWVRSVAKARSRFAFYVNHSVGANNGLWSTDGTLANTQLESGHRLWSELHEVGDRVLFVGTPNASAQTSLWSWDEAKLREIYSWPTTPDVLGSLHGELALEVPLWPIREFWTSDGTKAGTRLRMQLPDNTSIRAFAPLPGSARFLILADDGVYKSAPSGKRLNPVRLWRDAARPVPHAALTATANGHVFAATSSAHGAELWVTDGTTRGGTRLLRDIVPGPQSSDPSDFASAGSIAFFTARDTHGRELWCSDGTAAGTRRVLDLYPGPGGSDPKGTVCVGLEECAFAAFHPVYGREVWRFDAKTRRARLVANFRSPLSSEAQVLTRIDDKLYSLANDGQHGFELYITPLGAASWKTSPGCPHDPHPVLFASAPRIGQSQRLAISGLTVGEVSALVVGAPRASTASACTPAWDTARAFVLADAWRSGTPEHSVAIRFPKSRSVVGMRFAAQCLQLSRTATHGFRWSNGVECVVGH